MLSPNPPVELYLIRHAETVMNTNPHLVGGRSNDTPLTSKGIEQAKRLGTIMLSKGIMPQMVFVSPARRTIQTARYSLSEMGLSIEPIVHEDIQEQGQGSAEGKPRNEIYTEEVLQDILTHDKDFKLEGGESMNDVGERMLSWIKQTFSEEYGDSPLRYFVYTHGGAIKYLASHILGWRRQQTYETAIDNTSVNLFILQNGICEVRYLNRDAEEV